MIYVFLLLFVLIWWTLSGYYIFLDSLNNKYVIRPNDDDKRKLSIAVIVPCYNEESFIREKIRNLKALDYPADLFNVYFLDGISTDNTSVIIGEEIAGLGNFFLIETNQKGKIPQINHYLKEIREDVILQTDVDSLIPPGTLKKISAIFRDYQDVAVAGTCVLPQTSLREEALFWDIQNAMRFIESSRGMSSVVVASCFAYRRGLITEYPGDVIADDVFVPFKAQSLNKKSVYIADIEVNEVRSAFSVKSMFFHKLRKGNANMRELIRFFPIGIEKYKLWAVVFYTKFLQTFMTPLSLLLFVPISVYSFLIEPEAVLICYILLVISGMVSSHIIGKYRRISVGREFPTGLTVFALLNLTLIINLFTYPFYRQTSSYRKVNAVDGHQ